MSYSGKAAEAAICAKARRAQNGGYSSKLARNYAEAIRAARAALDCIESSHVQNNKFRMVVLGAQDIIYAVAALRSISSLKNVQLPRPETDQ